MKKPIKWLIGIDEAGRGPLAGPVAVGVVLVPASFDWQQVPGVNDSKQLSEAKREEIYNIANDLHNSGQLQYAVGLVSARVIDRIGIVQAVNVALKRALIRTTKPIKPIDWTKVSVKLDGGLKAPGYCVAQETIIKGDSKERVIGLASIMAKVTRDRYMKRIAIRPAFVSYDFARHKGYGTKVHRNSISMHGLSSEHRVGYCKNIKAR